MRTQDGTAETTGDATASADGPLVTEDELARAHEVLVAMEAMRDQIAKIADMLATEPTIVGEPERIVMIDFCVRLDASLAAVRPELHRLMSVLALKANLG
jgi:hypothetical protein